MMGCRTLGCERGFTSFACHDYYEMTWRNPTLKRVELFSRLSEFADGAALIKKISLAHHLAPSCTITHPSTMITITSSCHCKRFKYSFEVDETTLPVLDTTCNCTSCRRRTGQIAIFPFPAPAPSLPPKEYLDLLTSYSSFNESRKTTVTTYYCSTCGSKLLIAISDDDGKTQGGGWMLGCLDKTEGLMDIHGHSFLEDTIDGGVSQIWTKSNGNVDPYDYRSPDSPFDGAQRDLYLRDTEVRNSGGPTRWYTDPWGNSTLPPPRSPAPSASW